MSDTATLGNRYAEGAASLPREIASELARSAAADSATVAAPRILARIPDVDAPDTIPIPRGQTDGRLLSQSLSARLLFGGAALLVLAAVVPFMFGKRETPKPAAEVPNWHPGPAPGAETVPSWKNTAAESPRHSSPNDAPDGARDIAQPKTEQALPSDVANGSPKKPEEASPWPDPTRSMLPHTPGPQAPLPDTRQSPNVADLPEPYKGRSWSPPIMPTPAEVPQDRLPPPAVHPNRPASLSEPPRDASGTRGLPPPPPRESGDGQRTAPRYEEWNAPRYPDRRSESSIPGPAGRGDRATPGDRESVGLVDRRIEAPPADASSEPAGGASRGVARFEGIIEKPPVRTTYDRARPGVY